MALLGLPYDLTRLFHVVGEDSEVYLVARNIFRDPFRGGDNIIVMSDAYLPPNVGEAKDVPLTPIPTNTRHACMKVMEECAKEEPWFGIEQVIELLAS